MVSGPILTVAGYVVEAYDHKRGETVALKRVRKAEKKMSREYQILTKLKGNARCVELLDVFYTEGDNHKLTQNFVLEYVPDSLENFISRAKKDDKPIPVKDIKLIMKQLLEGLAFVHSKEICHRDLKPDNVLLDKQLNVKLCDFGSSKVLKRSSTTNIPHVVSRYYRAPELLLCHTDYTTEIDIWAAGCILVELFTKEPLFPGKSEGLQILEMMAILGLPRKSDREYLYSCLSEETRKLVEQVDGMKKMKFGEIFPKKYKKEDVEKAVSLAKSMLAWNPRKRITAKKALKHDFFK